jgi:hypothetical protein
MKGALPILTTIAVANSCAAYKNSSRLVCRVCFLRYDCRCSQKLRMMPKQVYCLSFLICVVVKRNKKRYNNTHFVIIINKFEIIIKIYRCRTTICPYYPDLKSIHNRLLVLKHSSLSEKTVRYVR